MGASLSSAARCGIAVLLMLAMMVAGIGHGFAAEPDHDSAVSLIPGVALTICHSGAHDPTDAPEPVSTHHCVQCALCAPVVVPDPPQAALVVPVMHDVEHQARVIWTARLARARTPRQSQGPPGA